MDRIQKEPSDKCRRWLCRNTEGWVVEGLLAALFTGLALVIILFSYIPFTPVFAQNERWTYFGITVIILLTMIVAYWGVAIYRKGRFKRGRQDHLLMRDMMAACIVKDCGELEQRFSDPDCSDALIFNQMLFFKVQAILENEDLRMRDIQARFEEIRIKPGNAEHLGNFFNTPQEYELTPLPAEFEAVFKALTPLSDQLHSQVAALKASRRALFTLLSDYIEMLAVTEADIRKVLETYRYNPPDHALARQIAFVIKVIDYLKGLHRDNLFPARRMAMEKMAVARVLQLKSAVKDYRGAWERLVKAYEALPLQ